MFPLEEQMAPTPWKRAYHHGGDRSLQFRRLRLNRMECHGSRHRSDTKQAQIGKKIISSPFFSLQTALRGAHRSETALSACVRSAMISSGSSSPTEKRRKPRRNGSG